MNRDEKAQAIEEIAADITAAEAIFAVDYRGISVPQAAELRAKLRESDASFRIVKNRLTKIAADKAGEGERLNALLQGPTALTFVRGDTAQAAKAISTFNNEHSVLTFKGGFMDGIDVDEDRFKAIAKLASRDVLNGQFAGVVASPLTGLVRGLASMIQGLALQLGQIAEKGLVTGEAPTNSSEGSTAGPVAAEGSSSSQAAGEEPTATPPADEAKETSQDEAPEADDQPAAEAKAEDEAPAEEAKADEAEPAAEAEQAEEKAEDDAAEDETSKTDDASKEEE